MERRPVVKSQNTESQSPGTLRKTQRSDRQLTCRLCGDKAVAHNFDVITCESCKTFFRRNALKPQKKCAFEDKCEITVLTRRFCPACRLRKCFEIGMKADMIMDEEERKARMDKIAENRRKRKLEAAKETRSANSRDSDSSSEHGIRTQSSESDSSRSDFDLNSQSLSPSADVPDAFLDLLASDVPDFHQSSDTSDKQPQCLIDQGEGQGQGPCQRQNLQNNDATFRCGRGSTFRHVPAALLPSDPQMYWQLTAEEQTLINQLTADYRETLLLDVPTTTEALQLRFEDMSLDDTLVQCERFAADTVKFMKRLPDFRALGINDQMAIVKGNCVRLILVKSTSHFSEERDAWLMDNGVLSVSGLALITQHPEFAQRHANLSRTLKRIVRDDYTGFALLCLMVLFEPQAALLSDRQMINTLYDKYAILMKHYLDSQYSYLFSDVYLQSLWDCLLDSKVLATEMTAVFSGWKDIVGPLMADVLDLR